MQKFWRTERFAELNKEWEEKLKEAGFEDAEEQVGGEKRLKQHSAYAYRRQECTQITRETKLSYFMLLAERVNSERKFDDESDRLIMTRTSEGWTIQEISTELKALGRRKFNRDTIRYIRRRYENRWGIRSWKSEQMVSRRVPTR